ncbi:hypothetical protein BABINDRAFT_11562 [Babjeviella inositovora NRRL Y-12698]|uniref:Uncharacterized protein n=1 Tax=Babjeviella inositovora NRRL Y-12698 TaxID=984486 RepID=A0A1E3QUR4_9ASCO|nr:uncharacterized protein BABINDRAFT_11562 [Babjeviella inositovora NRRL Y-12698]ODQ81410.1 hypothetical protein BABINDRAFT_11562 [Babjeviella inositovora NRRL Y-12698]
MNMPRSVTIKTRAPNPRHFGFASQTFRVSLDNTVADLKELIWQCSPGHSLVPDSFVVKYPQLSESPLTLAELLGVQGEYDDEYTVLITVDDSLLVAKDPRPFMFDITLEYDGEDTIREAYTSSVYSIKESILAILQRKDARFTTLDEFTVSYRDTVLEEGTIDHVVGLDLPPPEGIRLVVVSKLPPPPLQQLFALRVLSTTELENNVVQVCLEDKISKIKDFILAGLPAKLQRDNTPVTREHVTVIYMALVRRDEDTLQAVLNTDTPPGSLISLHFVLAPEYEFFNTSPVGPSVESHQEPYSAEIPLEPFSMVLDNGEKVNLSGNTYEMITTSDGRYLLNQKKVSSVNFVVTCTASAELQKVTLSSSQCFVVNNPNHQPYLAVSPSGLSKLHSAGIALSQVTVNIQGANTGGDFIGSPTFTATPSQPGVNIEGSPLPAPVPTPTQAAPNTNHDPSVFRPQAVLGEAQTPGRVQIQAQINENIPANDIPANEVPVGFFQDPIPRVLQAFRERRENGVWTAVGKVLFAVVRVLAVMFIVELYSGLSKESHVAYLTVFTVAGIVSFTRHDFLGSLEFLMRVEPNAWVRGGIGIIHENCNFVAECMNDGFGTVIRSLIEALAYRPVRGNIMLEGVEGLLKDLGVLIISFVPSWLDLFLAEISKHQAEEARARREAESRGQDAEAEGMNHAEAEGRNHAEAEGRSHVDIEISESVEELEPVSEEFGPLLNANETETEGLSATDGALRYERDLEEYLEEEPVNVSTLKNTATGYQAEGEVRIRQVQGTEDLVDLNS